MEEANELFKHARDVVAIVTTATLSLPSGARDAQFESAIEGLLGCVLNEDECKL